MLQEWRQIEKNACRHIARCNLLAYASGPDRDAAGHAERRVIESFPELCRNARTFDRVAPTHARNADRCASPFCAWR